jgi:hypothetical protein
MANIVTDPAAMPAPRMSGAPHFTEKPHESLMDFLLEYDALATAHGLTDKQKVQTLSRYVPSHIQEFWHILDGYAADDWRTYWAAIEKIYPDTSTSTHFSKKVLWELVDSWVHTPMWDEEDVLQYYRWFLKHSNPLCTVQTLLEEDCNAKFFEGFHPEDHKVINNHLHAMKPNHPEDKPYDFEDTFEAAWRYFSNAQFYHPLQRCHCDKEWQGSDLWSDYDWHDLNAQHDYEQRNFDVWYNYNWRNHQRHDDDDCDYACDYDRQDHDASHVQDLWECDHYHNRNLQDKDCHLNYDLQDHNAHHGHDPQDYDHCYNRHNCKQDCDYLQDCHQCDQSHNQEPIASQPEYMMKTVCFQDSNTTKNNDNKELGDLIQQMHGLSVHDVTYSALYALCKHCFPDVAQDLAKPAAHLFQPSSTLTYQAPANAAWSQPLPPISKPGLTSAAAPPTPFTYLSLSAPPTSNTLQPWPPAAA